MKLKDAKKLIKTNQNHIQQHILNAKPKKKKLGFRVNFSIKDGHILKGDHFPERDEPMIKTEQQAWKLATEFAHAHPNAVDIYVVNQDWLPVQGYNQKILNKI